MTSGRMKGSCLDSVLCFDNSKGVYESGALNCPLINHSRF